MSLEKSFDEISEADLQELIDNGVPERKNIEYKEALPDNKYESKKEFLADISSFANTVGGHILYGVKEENGVPTNLVGVSNGDLDSEVLRLENLMRDNIQPRLQGVSIRHINVEASNPVLIIRIPKSWSKPHVVNFQGHWRFYARNSAGKYPLDVLELKSAFLATTALGEKIRNFHFDRLSRIASDETPVQLAGKAKVILHLIPYSAFESGLPLDFTLLGKDIWSIPLIDSSLSGYRHNLDGLVAYNERGDNIFGAYTQVFRSGIFEMVSTRLFNSREEDLYIPSIVLEEELINTLTDCIALHQKSAINPPSVILASFTGVRGYKLAVSQRLDAWHQQNHRIDRDTLILPEVIVEGYGESPATILKPILDAIWNSAGWQKSYGYDEEGEWGKGPNFIR